MHFIRNSIHVQVNINFFRPDFHLLKIYNWNYICIPPHRPKTKYNVLKRMQYISLTGDVHHNNDYTTINVRRGEQFPTPLVAMVTEH